MAHEPTSIWIPEETGETFNKGIKFLESKFRSRSTLSAGDGAGAMALHLAGSSAVETFISQSNRENFWEDIRTVDFPYRLIWSMKLLDKRRDDGWRKNPSFRNRMNALRKIQDRDGRIIGEGGHPGQLLPLLIGGRNWEETQRAIDYLLDNWDDITGFRSGPMNLICLTELGINDHSEKIREYRNILLSNFDSSKWCNSPRRYESNPDRFEIEEQAYTVIGLLRTGEVDELPESAIEALIETQTSDGYWFHGMEMRDTDDYPDVEVDLEEKDEREAIIQTGTALLALAMTQYGPVKPVGRSEWQIEIKQQEIESVSPEFVATRPASTLHKRETKIHDVVSRMLRRAERNVRISSLHIDMLYDEIIDLAKAESDTDIRILARESVDRGGRQSIKKQY